MPELYEITCPHCAKVYELPREKIAKHAGSKIQCKTCTGVFLMPALPEVASAPATRPDRALVGAGTDGGGTDASSSTQTPWPFAFAADDDDEEIRDVEVEASDTRKASNSDTHFAEAALSDTFVGNATLGDSDPDETIDVEHEPTRTQPKPQSQPVADRINAVAGKLPVTAPFQEDEIAANKIKAEKAQRKAVEEQIERPVKKKHRRPVSREVLPPAPPVPAAEPAIDPDTLAAVQGDLRSIRRWLQFAGWLVILGLLAAVALPTLTYFGIIDWTKLAEFWNGNAS
ncbi:MAG: zinc-ribbon domain-containing protein [Planctomycetota bacterium]